MRRFVALLFPAALLACSSSKNDGSPGAPLDCSWLASDNCFKQAVGATASCLPPSGERGTLSQDGSTCTYASGRTVVFDAPLTLPLPMEPVWKFTLNYQGQLCLRVEGSPQSQFTVTTSAGSYVESASGLGIAATCPDGRAFSNSNAFDLFNCDGGLASFPGTAWSSSDTSVNLSLLGTSAGSTVIFDCAKQ